MVQYRKFEWSMLPVSSLVALNPPPAEVGYHVDRCYKAAKRMMVSIIAQAE